MKGYDAATAVLGDDVSVTLHPFGLPAFIEPRRDILKNDLAAALDWVTTRRKELDALQVIVGAIVLRGFPFPETNAFNALVDLFPSTAFDYAGGATPRASVAGKVFEATRAPPDMKIVLHQEMAYLPHFPKRLAFFCQVAPHTGGETIIADMRKFDRALNPNFRDRVRERGVLYTRNFRTPDVSTGDAALDAVHRPWTDAFSTTDPAVAQAACEDMGLEVEWCADGSMTTRYRGEGVRKHPVTGEEIWFNQLAQQHFWSPKNLGPERSAMFQRIYGGKPKPYEACYGDGEPVDPDDIDSVFPIYDSLTVAFPWQACDVMLLDNFFVAHGRNPYQGDRNVQVALLN